MRFIRWYVLVNESRYRLSTDLNVVDEMNTCFDIPAERPGALAVLIHDYLRVWRRWFSSSAVYIPHWIKVKYPASFMRLKLEWTPWQSFSGHKNGIVAFDSGRSRRCTLLIW